MTTVEWLYLLLIVSVAMWPIVGSAGIAIGRMQVQDQMKEEDR